MTIEIVRFSQRSRRTIELFEHEFQNMLEALRRDLRTEDLKSTCGGEEDSKLHRINVRCNKHLLGVLQPKKARELVSQPVTHPTPQGQPVEVSLVTFVHETVIEFSLAGKDL